MNTQQNTNVLLNRLTVLRGLGDDPLIAALLEYQIHKTDYAYNDLLAETYKAGAQDAFLAHVQSLILADENAFSRECAKGNAPSRYIRNAYYQDLTEIFDAVERLYSSDDLEVGRGVKPFGSEKKDVLLGELEKFYKKHGCGQFIGHRAFEYADGLFVPLTGLDEVSLDMLKGYESEKAAIENNVSDFLNGLPYSHMLLYGDRGTGKSSTVHAMLNKHAGDGLRLIELDKRNLTAIKNIKQSVAGQPLKFIIFIDDLSLDEQDGCVSALKAAVEGSMVGGNNVMVVATSNRRHVIKENLSDRDNSVHPSDSMEEQLSLSDRFGLTVMFSTTDKASYLSIVAELAADCGLITPADRLQALAERWAVMHGGRSPRRAKQFVDYAYACEKSQREIDF